MRWRIEVVLDSDSLPSRPQAPPTHIETAEATAARLEAAQRRDAAAVKRDLRTGVKATTPAEKAAYLWAVSVRQIAEARLGVGRDDERVIEDSDYRAALLRFTELETLRKEAERLLASSESDSAAR